MKNFGEILESMGVSRDCPIFWVSPIISGMGKATNFKSGRYINTVHRNKSLIKILEKGSVGISRDCPIFWGAMAFGAEKIYKRQQKSDN